MLNDGQRYIFDEAMKFRKRGNEKVFHISGPPGTGKTYLMNTIADAYGLPQDKVACMAYTGAAAINMRIKGMINARTCMSWMYDFIEVDMIDSLGRIVYDPVFDKPLKETKFIPKKALPGIELIFLDEGAFVTPEVRKHMEKLNIQMIVGGDINQLPPPDGASGFFTENDKIYFLNEIMRQEKDNNIIHISNMALNKKPIHNGWYGNVLVIYEDELTDEMISQSNVILCGKNKTRDRLNSYIRKRFMNTDSELPILRDRIVCRKNNWSLEVDGGINLTNGLLGNCYGENIMTSMNASGNKLFALDFKPDLSNSIFKDLLCDYRYFTADANSRKFIKNSPYSIGEKFEFGYAITTHMAQGSEYNNGIYFEEYLNPDINHRLNYVGASRFRNFLIYVKKRPSYY